MTFCGLADPCLAQPSSEKLPPCSRWGANTDTHSQIIGGARDLGTLGPKKDVSTTYPPPFKGPRDSEEEEAERVEEPEGMVDTKESRPSRHNRAGHRSPQRQEVCAGPAQICTR